MSKVRSRVDKTILSIEIDDPKSYSKVNLFSQNHDGNLLKF